MKNLETSMKIASASVFCFYLKVHYVHLNITGPNFWAYHKMLDDIYKDVFESFDAISEQVRSLDIFAPASLTEFHKLTVVQDMLSPADPLDMIHELLLDNDKLIDVLSEANMMAEHHLGLQNFLQGRCDAHEKIGWMLRATITNS